MSRAVRLASDLAEMVALGAVLVAIAAAYVAVNGGF